MLPDSEGTFIVKIRDRIPSSEFPSRIQLAYSYVFAASTGSDGIKILSRAVAALTRSEGSFFLMSLSPSEIKVKSQRIGKSNMFF